MEVLHFRRGIYMETSEEDSNNLTAKIMTENGFYYTMDEIDDRLDKAEQDFDAGLGKNSEDVFEHLDENFHSECMKKNYSFFYRR